MLIRRGWVPLYLELGAGPVAKPLWRRRTWFPVNTAPGTYTITATLLLELRKHDAGICINNYKSSSPLSGDRRKWLLCGSSGVDIGIDASPTRESSYSCCWAVPMGSVAEHWRCNNAGPETALPGIHDSRHGGVWLAVLLT